MKSKQTIFLLGGFLTPLLQQLLVQNGYPNVTRIPSYTKFEMLKKKHAIRLIIGSLPGTKNNLLVNKFCMTKGVVWLPYRFFPEKSILDIGPVIGSKQSACYSCYEKRLRENIIPWTNTAKMISPGMNKPSLELIAAIHIVRIAEIIIAGKLMPGSHQTTLISLHIPTGQLAAHTLLQHPLCLSCKTVAPNKNITLCSRKIIYTENGLRMATQEETWHKVRSHIHHAGILTGILRLDKPIQGLTTFQVISADPLGNNRYRAHSGKGMTDAQNKISGSVEAIERYCAKFALLDPFRREITASYDELGRSAIHPARFQIGIANFTDRKKIKWVPAWSLKHNRSYFVPLEYVSLIPFGSNGLASGNCMEEAILHGIFEMVERDVYMIMDLQEMVMPDLDTRSITDKRVVHILKQLNKSGFSYHVKIIKNDLNIPAFGMYITGKIPQGTGYAHAVCAHLDRDIALSRTVTEAVQQFPKVSTGLRWLDKNTDHYTKKGSDTFVIKDIPSFKKHDLKENINRCLTLLDNLGLEVLVVDHSLPGLDFSVVRVLIPGLQPIWFKESPSIVDRTFSLPEKLGFPVKTKERLNYGRYSGFPYYVK